MSTVCKRALLQAIFASIALLACSAARGETDSRSAASWGVAMQSDDPDDRGNKCNVDPTLNRLFVTLATTKSPEEFGAALVNNPLYRDLVGDITYLGPSVEFPGMLVVAFPPLNDPVLVVDHMRASREFGKIYGDGRACFAAPLPSVFGTALEYYSAPLDHYFFTADAKEQQALDSGMVPGTWVRTGQSFRVTVAPGCPIAIEGGTHPIYRFTGEPNLGPRSHFFTASQDECAVLRDRADWHWLFEGLPFWASEPINGGCPVPLYRAYNNGKGGEPNHRYATDPAVIVAMVAQGWVDEGVAMCVTASP